MKAIAVIPRRANSVHLVDVPPPRLDAVPGGRGVRVRLLKVGVDGTDKEINQGLYGAPPPGDDFLIIGHESFGVVEEVGAAVTEVKPGDFVSCTVRRPGASIFDQIGDSDMTSEETYYERGINLLHGFLTEHYVDDVEYIVKVPPGVKHLHVLVEPMSCAAKAIMQVYEAQRRLKVWRPRRAFVAGAGQIGILCTLSLRLRGLEVYTFARSPRGTLNSRIIEDMGAHYVSTRETPLDELVKKVGKADIFVEAAGSSEVAFGAMGAIGHNGVVVWTGITAGDTHVEVPGDKINLDWVLGNKLLLGSVNANRGHFELGIRDLATGEAMYPGVLGKMLTHPLVGLDQYQEMIRLLTQEKSALKVFIEVGNL